MTKDTERLTLRMPKRLKKQLEACSVQMGISLNSLMVQLLWRWVQEQKEKEART